MSQIHVRPPAVANMFYPGDVRVLSKGVTDLLERAEPERVRGPIVALICPHAGYQYSGFTAAHGYKLLIGNEFDSVVIVSPSHREGFEGISVFNGSAYQTPLGDLYVDKEIRSALCQNDSMIKESTLGHHNRYPAPQEHAIEVQLPFIQKVLGDVKITPIVMGIQRREYCFHLGGKLAQVLNGKNVLLIASSDLSHYHPAQEAEALDQVVIRDIDRFDYEQLMEDLESERGEACGGGPTVAVLIAAKKLGADRVTILHHCNSGDVTGDRSAVVGYLSAVASRTN